MTFDRGNGGRIADSPALVWFIFSLCFTERKMVDYDPTMSARLRFNVAPKSSGYRCHL
jgi:hypothetical protein